MDKDLKELIYKHMDKRYYIKGLIFYMRDNSVERWIRQTFGLEDRNWSKTEQFFRKGKHGSYKKEIPEDLIKFFEKESFSQLKYFDYL